MFNVSFINNGGRSGNLLFQYLICKLISLLHKHTYIHYEEFSEKHGSNGDIIIQEEEMFDILQGKHSLRDISASNVLIKGFFQNSDYFFQHRSALVDLIYNEIQNNIRDFWIFENKTYFIHDFLTSTHNICLKENDVVMSLRLDDFIQYPCATSDIIPPQYYMSILESLHSVGQLYIVCDYFRHDWEHQYIKFFDKWTPKLVQQSLLQDCALMRDCSNFIHSNSTLSWMMSFFSKNKKMRFIPKTNFYSMQYLNKIQDFDIVTNVTPLLHQEVHELNINNNKIFPLAYCIPNECIVDDSSVYAKVNLTIELNSSNSGGNYHFNKEQEKEYNDFYRASRFAETRKKGGWDCLRHYEILANGCIPIFADIVNCPEDSLVTFPKELVNQCYHQFFPWEDSEYSAKEYDDVRIELLNHTRNKCSTSSCANYFFSKLSSFPGNSSLKKILLISGNYSVNYTRELTWIGIKRQIQGLGGIAVEYPKISYLYDDYSREQLYKDNLYGNGFTYSKRLKNDYNFEEAEIIDKIKNKFWDLIVFGRVGPDEFQDGSIPHLPLWNIIKEKYNKNKIVFLYGGDNDYNLKRVDRYSQHLLYHSQYGTCFVRELNNL